MHSPLQICYNNICIAKLHTIPFVPVEFATKAIGLGKLATDPLVLDNWLPAWRAFANQLPMQLPTVNRLRLYSVVQMQSQLRI